MTAGILIGIIIAAICCGIILFMFISWFIGGIIEHKKTKKPFKCCLGYHRPIGKVGFDGCSATCTCGRCKANLLQDSQGNWFEA